MDRVVKGAQMNCSALVCCLDEAVVAAVRSNSLAELWGCYPPAKKFLLLVGDVAGLWITKQQPRVKTPARQQRQRKTPH